MSAIALSPPPRARRPLIALTGRRIPGAGLRSLEPRYQVHAINWYFSAFSTAVAAAGGIPVELPYECGADVVERIDALVVTGGQDIDPTQWGGDPSYAVGPVDRDRDAYELGLVGAAFERGIPVLGICRGMQLVNVMAGGTLVGHLSSTGIDHVSSRAATSEQTHVVATDPGSLARSLFGAEVAVNSLHHQAVDRPGEGVVITGRAPDGVAEVLEMPGRPVLGVQWHPEWHDGRDPSFNWIVNAASDIAFGCYEHV